MGVYENLLKKKIINENEDGSVSVNHQVLDDVINSKPTQQPMWQQINDMTNSMNNKINETVNENMKILPTFIQEQVKPFQNSFTSMTLEQKKRFVDNQQAELVKKVSDTFSRPLWEQIQDFANDTGRTIENTWLGTKHGIEDSGNYINSMLNGEKTQREKELTRVLFSDLSNEQKRMYLAQNSPLGLLLNEQSSEDIAKTINDSVLPIKIDANKIEEARNMYKSMLPINLTDENLNTMRQYIKDNYDKDKVEKIAKTDVKAEERQKENEKIAQNIEEQTNPVAKKLAEVAPSVGQMLPGMALSTVNPALGTTYFITSAGGGYLQDAKNRGMDETQSKIYATAMGIMEGLTEKISVGNLKKAGKAMKTAMTAGKGIVKEEAKQIATNSIKDAIKNYGIGIAENTIQEAIMEPIQETMAGLVADKADWDNMPQRMLDSGINGGIVAVITGGGEIGINSCVAVMNKIQNGEVPTQQEIKIAYDDYAKAVGEEKAQNDFKEGAKNAISAQNQQTTIENKPSNVQEQQITPPIQENVSNQNLTSNEQQNSLKGKSFEDIVDEAMSNYENDEVKSPLQNRDIKTIGKEKVNAYQYDNPEVKPYFQQMAQMLGEDVGNIASQDNRKTVKGGGTSLNTNISAIEKLHNEMGYSYNQIIDGIVNIIDDHGKENNALSKKLEIIIDDQLRNGYVNSYGKFINPNEEYINLINNSNQNKGENKQKKYEIKELPEKNGTAFQVDSDIMDVVGHIPENNSLPFIDQIFYNNKVSDDSYNEQSIPKEYLRKGNATNHVLSVIDYFKRKGIGEFQVKTMNENSNALMESLVRKGYINQLTDYKYLGDDVTYKINTKLDNLANNQQINNFSGYTQKEINNIKSNKISIAQSSEDISKFVNNSRKIPGNFKMYLGKIKESASNLIKNKLGINVDNYNISLKTDDVRKIFKDHGSEKTEIPRGQVPITENDFLNIPNIINNPDSISLEGKSPQGKPAIKFEKNIDGNTVVVTYVSDKHNNLEMQTMYKFKNNKKRDSATALHENQAPGLNTSEMDSGTNLFINNSIPQNNNFVKNDTITNNYEQNLENNTQNTPGEEINWNKIEKPEGKFRKHYQSIIESSNTTAEAKAIAKEMMGTDTYVPESNQSLIQKADSRISNTNPDTELNSLYSRVMNNEKVTDIDIAVGERLIEYYSKIGDKEHLADAIHATAMAGTQAGRTVQAFALLNHMTPQGQVVWLQRSIDKVNNELQQKYRNKKNIPQFELTQEMTDKVLNTDSQEEMFKVLDDVYEELGQQVPKSMSEKINEWRYFSMLANLKTHGRNMIGNIAMHITQRAKDKVAGAIEGVVSKFNPEMERTHTIVPTNKAVKDFAKNDVKNMDVQTQLEMNENKYNPQSRLQNARKTFKHEVFNKTLGELYNLNSKLLGVEDNIGLKSMYVKALGEYITANKLDINNITDAQLAKARQHAIKEAKEATFHQASSLATALNQMGRKSNIKKFALDAVVPFKKTPINVAKTGVQYSPVGLIKSAVYDATQLRKGNITINEYINNISKGLTGTGIAYLGYALAEAGILKASGGDDDRKEKYDENQGKQTYSLEIGGKTYSLDWLSPVGIPLFIGVETNQQFNQAKKEKNTKSSDDDELISKILKSVTNIANGMSNAMNPMSEMSMVSGLTSTLSSYNKENAVGDMLVNAGKSYVNQFVPTSLGQLARTTDDYERTTKSTKTGTLEKAFDSTINQIKSKIPGLRQTLPVKTDTWGKEVKQSENLPFRAFNNFINPSKIQDVSNDKVDKELNNLYGRTKESSIIPKAIEKTLSINGTDYRMTNDEYADYSKKFGNTAYNLLSNLVDSKEYKALDDKQKQKAIESVYNYANEANKVDYAKKVKEEVKTDYLYNTMKALGNYKSQSKFLNYVAQTTGMDKESEKNKVLLDSDIDNTAKAIIYANTMGKDDKVFNIAQNTMNTNQYLEYKVRSSNDEFKADKDKNGNSISGSAKKKIYNYINSNISGYENRLIMLASQYKLSRAEQQKVVDYINKNSKTNEEVMEKLEKLSQNFQVKDGKVYFK